MEQVALSGGQSGSECVEYSGRISKSLSITNVSDSNIAFNSLRNCSTNSLESILEFLFVATPPFFPY